MVHKRPLDLHMRSEYHELVHNCLNSEFQDKYDLKLKTYIEYCQRAEEIIEQGKYNYCNKFALLQNFPNLPTLSHHKKE